MSADAINAAGTVLSAAAALIAVVVAWLSIREIKRIDDRSRVREWNERDDLLQNRLESLYPDLYVTFGSPRDGIPLESRPVVVAFYSLYADAFTAQRDNLLPVKDAESFLREFAYWARTEHGRRAWEDLRLQTWAEGFLQHVDHALGIPESYRGLNYAPPLSRWISGGRVVHYVEGLNQAALASAVLTLRSLRSHGSHDVPPMDTDHVDPDETNRAYIDWLIDTDTAIWNRWMATLQGRVVGHVCVSGLHDYLANNIDIEESAAPEATRMLEVNRLFVDPLLQGFGIGADLLKLATDYILSLEAVPVLAMIEDEGLQSWYQNQGWSVRSTYEGIQGPNVVMEFSVGSLVHDGHP
ncbi:MAG: GNAT family N-acetyltransferase [Candidatus Nanopelagicales bacterium]